MAKSNCAEKRSFFSQLVAERTNDTALYTNMKTTLTRQISLFVTQIYLIFSRKASDRS